MRDPALWELAIAAFNPIGGGIALLIGYFDIKWCDVRDFFERERTWA